MIVNGLDDCIIYFIFCEWMVNSSSIIDSATLFYKPNLVIDIRHVFETCVHFAYSINFDILYGVWNDEALMLCKSNVMGSMSRRLHKK
jgi:hypothetical protein